MFVGHVNDRTCKPVTPPSARNVLKQSLIGPGEGWKGWAMRQFTLQDRGYTPRHRHPWPHINYVISGKGVLFLEGKEHQLKPGSIAYIPENAEHQFSGTGDEDFTFVCIVPEEGDV